MAVNDDPFGAKQRARQLSCELEERIKRDQERSYDTVLAHVTLNHPGVEDERIQRLASIAHGSFAGVVEGAETRTLAFEFTTNGLKAFCAGFEDMPHAVSIERVDML